MSVIKCILVVFLGYLIACITVPFTLVSLTGDEIDVQMTILGTMITVVYSAPGFVLLRGVLALARMKFVGWFLIAGAANSIIAIRLFGETSETSMLLSGAAAGLAVWLTESVFPGGPIIITKRNINNGT